MTKFSRNFERRKGKIRQIRSEVFLSRNPGKCGKTFLRRNPGKCGKPFLRFSVLGSWVNCTGLNTKALGEEQDI